MAAKTAKAKKQTTTIKVSRKVMRHIESVSKPSESVDDTLRRMLKLISEEDQKPVLPPPLTTTIKVSRMVMNHIIKQSKKEESRDHTLCRLLGIEQDDGNVKGK